VSKRKNAFADRAEQILGGERGSSFRIVSFCDG